MLVRVLAGNLLEYGEHLLAPIAKLGERELALGVGGLLLSRWRVSHPLGAEVEASKRRNIEHVPYHKSLLPELEERSLLADNDAIVSFQISRLTCIST